MKAEYIEAIETRLRWARWSKTQDAITTAGRLHFGHVLIAYRDVLETGDTFAMNPMFFDMVEHARASVPDDLPWDEHWLLSSRGFLWLPKPFLTPPVAVLENGQPAPPGLQRPSVQAIGWRPVLPGTVARHSGTAMHGEEYVVEKGATQFACFQSFNDPNQFGAWSYFIVEHGDLLGPRIRLFEERQSTGKYAVDEGRIAAPLHEIRWIYTAFHLMAQRLAIDVKHPVDRATRRRAERSGQIAPPFIRVVTLRRLEADRQQAHEAGEVDWQWQWTVRGHWRNQFYPGEGIHKPKFIEAYVKGPTDRPMKPDTIKLFVAER